MQQYFARIIRAVIVSALGFGGGIGLLIFISVLVTTGQQVALDIALRSAVVIGIGFGVFLAALFLLTDMTSRLFAGKQRGYKEIWDLEQTREIILDGPLKDVRRLCREALLAVPNIKAVKDDDELSMSGSVGASWKSPGEKMEIKLAEIGESKWRARCTSKCLASHISFDYAKNFENVEAWQKSLHRMLEDAHTYYGS